MRRFFTKKTSSAAINTTTAVVESNNNITNNTVNSMNTKSIISKLITNNDSMIFNVFISMYNKYLPIILENLNNPTPKEYMAKDIEYCYEEDSIAGVFKNYMNINISTNMNLQDFFIRGLFKSEIHRSNFYENTNKLFFELNKLKTNNLDKYIKVFNKLLQNTYGQNEFPDLDDNDLEIGDLICEQDKLYFLSDDEVKSKVSAKLLKILNAVIFLNQGLIQYFSSSPIYIENLNIGINTLISTIKLCVLDSKNKIINFIGYLREEITSQLPFNILRGIVILTVDITRIEKDVHFVYIPMYPCKITSLPLLRDSNNSNTNSNNNIKIIRLEKIKIFTQYFKIIFNKAHNLNILDCLDYKYNKILRIDSKNKKLSFDVDRGQSSLNKLTNDNLLKYNSGIADVDCSDSPLDGLITLINSYLVSEGNELKLFDKIPVDFMIAINGNILKKMLTAQGFVIPEDVSGKYNFNLFDVVKINDGNLYYYKCLDTSLYHETKFRFPSEITRVNKHFSYTFIITSIEMKPNEDDIEKPLNVDEIIKIMDILDKNKDNKKDSFFEMIVKDFDKVLIYISSFNTRNILALSLFKYLLDINIEDTLNIFPKKINITNWTKILKLYYITNFLLLINQYRLMGINNKIVEKNINNLINLSGYLNSIDLGTLNMITTKKYLNTETTLENYLSAIILDPFEYIPFNYFEVNDVMDLLLPPRQTKPIVSNAGGARKKLQKTRKYKSRNKKYSKKYKSKF